MGKGTNVSMEYFGVKINFTLMSATATDANMIKGVFQEVGYEKVKHIYDQSPELQQAFDDTDLDFPDEGNEN